MTPTASTRFWSKVEGSGPDECWLWRAARDLQGYGRFKFDGRTHYAHRLAYEQMVGEIQPGLVLDHLCRTPSCVNWTHLEQVSIGENVMRGTGVSVRNAAKTVCPRGHDYTPDNTILKAGKRDCRACDLHRKREAYARKAA